MAAMVDTARSDTYCHAKLSEKKLQDKGGGLGRVTPLQSDIRWRGYGGGVPTVDSVEFDKQLDKLSIWLETWNHNQRCAVIECLVHWSQHRQFQLLWTVIQPALHRDFMYSARRHFTTLPFTPLSSHTSRQLKERMTKMHTDTYHRIESAHPQRYDQLTELHTEKTLPAISSTRDETRDREASTESGGDLARIRRLEYRTRPGISRANTSLIKKSASLPHLAPGSVARNVARSDSGIQSAIFDGTTKTPTSLLKTAPACLRFLEMPLRRHQQLHSPPPEVDNGRGHVTTSSHRSDHSTDTMQSSSLTTSTARETETGWSSSLPPNGARLLAWYAQHWGDSQRNEFLHKFLLKLDPRQHYFISTLLAVKKSQDFLSHLPVSIAIRILSYLLPHELATASRVNKAWYYLCNNNELWRLKCQFIQIDIPIKITKPNWKSIYRENKGIKQNWKSGHCKTIDCKGHSDKVLCVTFNDTRLATGSSDRTIRLWSLRDGRCVCTLTGHVRGVWCLRFFTDNLLISASFDSAIKIWSVREGRCLRSLLGHQGAVWCIVLKNNVLVSVSQDKTAKIWDISRCLLLRTLEGHTGPVFTADMDEQASLLVTGAGDRTVRLWDVQLGHQLKVIWASPEASIMSVSYSHSHLACCYAETIAVYKIKLDRSGKDKRGAVVPGVKLINTYEEHVDRVESIELSMKVGGKTRGTMVSASKDGTIKYWSLARTKSVQTLSGHSQAVNCIHCDETKIVSASYDNKVKIWDFSVKHD